MSSFGLDNAGSGFALDDDDDASTMFDRAAASAEDSGDDAVLHSSPKEDDEQDELERILSSHSNDESEQATESSIELVEDEEPTPEPEPKPEPVVTPEPVVAPKPEPKPEPVVAPEPVYTPPAPVETPQPTPRPAGRVRVPTEKDQLEDTARIIAVLDTYRSLNKDEKSVAIQFFSNGELEVAEDHVAVVKALNVNPQLAVTMRAFRQAFDADPVERAFFTIGLSTETLHSLGELVSVFSEAKLDESLSNLDYSRKVVAALSELGEREINFVKVTESVLAAAENAKS